MANFIELIRTDEYSTAIKTSAIVGISGNGEKTTIFVGSSDEPFISEEPLEQFLIRSGLYWIIKGGASHG